MRMKLISGETLEEELGGGRANVRLNHAGIARNAHVAPAKLRASSPPRGGDESGDAPADAAAKKPKPKSALWQRALVAAVAEAHVDDWVDVRSDEDDASVEWNGSDRDDDDDDDDDVEDAEEENSELAPGELPRFLAPRPPTTRRGIERALIRAVPRKRATDDDAEGFATIHSVDWSHQNLSRVPPKLPSSPHRAKNLRAIDVSHNFIAKLPSSLARFTRLERIDASDNRLATLPAALGRCLRLKALIVSRNDLRDLGGTWIAELPELTRLDLDGNDRLREPPPFVADMGLRAVREYLRATRLVRDWDEDDVTVFDRRATGGELSAALRIARCDARARLEGRDEDEEAAACRRDARGGERPPDLRYVAHKIGFWRRFVSLTVVDLRGARMTSLPDEIQHCITLQEMRVDGNRLRAIPDVSRTAFDLRVLTAAECELSTVPEWLGACRKLHTLELGRNKITSPIVSLRECVSLRVLDISSNDVRALPELPRGLTRLLASENKIDDVSAATSCADIHTLDAERNKITSLPDDIAELHKLVVLKVAKNLLRSVDAPNMSRRASRLETFTFSQNPLGAIPWWLADVPLSALEPRFINETAAVRELRHTPNYAVTLDLGNRGLLHAPTIHPHFPSLTTLDLSHNSIGFLPSHVSELTALEVLRLNDNFITFLPDCSKMKNLRDLRAHSNRLMSVHASVCTLRQLETLYIGKNPLSALPDLTPCLKLKTLWMAECRFESLPLHIADCPSLTNFYAEGNPLKFPEPSVYEKEGNLGLLAHLKNINENKREQEEMSRIREAEKARKIKAKEEKAAARLRAILRFGKSHLAREEESEEEEEEEEEDDDDDADTVRSGATAATARSAKTATSSSSRSTKRRGAKAPSMGKVLWRRLRQVVVDDSSNKREAVVQARMDYDTLLRVRDLKFAVKLADANAALAATNAELRDAELERADADENLARAVEEVRAIRRKMADQRALMEKFKSISSDTLQELQEKLRDAKVALAEAVGRKEAADAIVATKERRARELSIEIFNLEERAVAVKDELETRSRERLLAKMAKRRSDLEALRETARKGEATMAAVERANESSLLTRMQTRKKDLASRDEKEAAAVREAAADAKGAGLGYLLAVGMDKTTDETTRAKASKAWGKLQLMNGLGLLRGRASGKMGLEEVKEKDPADA